MTEKINKPLRKVKTSEAVAGSGSTALIVFFWNMHFPDNQMDATVAAAATCVVGPFVAWFASWLPKPESN